MRKKRSSNNQNDKLKVTLTYRPVEGERARLGKVMRMLLNRKDSKQRQKNQKGSKT